MLSQFLRAAAIKPASAITFVGVTEQTTGTGNSFSIAYPTGTADGDLAFLCLSTDSNLGENFTSTGWTTLNRTTSTGNVKAQLLYRVVSGTGTQSFTKGGITTSHKAMILAVFRNATYSSFNTATSSGAIVNPPSLTGSFNAVVVFGNINADDSAIDPPSGYTDLGEINNSSAPCTTTGAYLISASTNPDPAAFGSVASSQFIAYTIGLT